MKADWARIFPARAKVFWIGRLVALCLITSLAAVRGQSPALLTRTNLLQFVGTDQAVHLVQTTNDWRLRRQSILSAMQEVMGPMPRPEKRCPLEVHVEEEVDCGDYLRRFVTYAAEPGGRVPAYLLIPKAALSASRQFPGVLTLHQTHPAGQKVVVGLGQSPNDEYGVELVRRGYVCLAPAYPQWANYQPDLKKLGYASGTMKAIWDNRRGLDLLESLSFVKPGRFGAIGHSLGGHNALFTAAFEERLVAVVSSCGFDSFQDYKDGNIVGWTSERYMPRLRAYSPETRPFDFHEILGSLAPRAVFISAPLGDTNFKWRSVAAVTKAAQPIFRLLAQPDQLRVEHPDCGHLFPESLRIASYLVLDRALKIPSPEK